MRFKFDKKDKQLSQKQSYRLMKRPPGTKKPPSAESIARLADTGKDVSTYFTNKGRMMPPVAIDPSEDRESTSQQKEGMDSSPQRHHNPDRD